MSKFCVNCGSAVAPEVRFCSECGANLDGAQPNPVVQTPHYQPPQPIAPAIAPAPVPSYQPPQHQEVAPQHPNIDIQPEAPAPTPSDHPPQPTHPVPEPEYTPPEPQPTDNSEFRVPGSEFAPPHAQPAAKPLGMAKTLISLLIMNIPVVGIALSIIWGMDKVNTDRRDLARAMIVITAIWHIIFIIGFVLLLSMLRQIGDLVDLEFSVFGIQLI